MSNKNGVTDTINNHSYDVSGLQVSLVEKQSQLTSLNKAGVSCVIASPDVHDIATNGIYVGGIDNLQVTVEQITQLYYYRIAHTLIFIV